VKKSDVELKSVVGMTVVEKADVEYMELDELAITAVVKNVVGAVVVKTELEIM